MSMPRFVLHNVWAGYGDEVVLRGVELEIPGGFFVVVGPSGCGKSTLLRLLNRLLDPLRGEILLDGKPLRSYPVRLLRRRVGMVFQKPVLFDGTVAGNIRFAAPRISDDELFALLESVALGAEYAFRRSDELSVGEAQRVCLARTLATKPEVLLLDEPTSALDPTATGIIEDLLRKLVRDVSIICVTHNVAQAMRFEGSAAMLYDGKVHWVGSTKELGTTDDELVRRFVAGELDGRR